MYYAKLKKSDQKAIYCISPFILYSRKGKAIETKRKSKFAKGWGLRNGVDYKGGIVLVNRTIN